MCIAVELILQDPGTAAPLKSRVADQSSQRTVADCHVIGVRRGEDLLGRYDAGAKRGHACFQ